MRDGRLVQFAAPAELLANPVDEFVADFVGSDRALKSLSLTRLEEVELVAPPTVAVGEPTDGVRERIARGDLIPMLDQVTTLRDALSALLEANAAYGVVVDHAGATIGLLGIGEVASVFRLVGSAG